MGVDYYSKEIIGGVSDYYSREVRDQPSIPTTPPFGGKMARFVAPVGGAIASGMAFGEPLTAAGAEIGTAIAPGIGTVIGGGLGAGASAFLGALAGERTRQRFQAAATHTEPPPFGEAVREAAPFGTFGAAGEAAGIGLKSAAPLLKNAPRIVKMFTRTGTIANTATRSAAGGFAAGTTEGLTKGKSIPQAVGQGIHQAPLAGLLGGALQTVPSAIQTLRGGNVQEAGSALMNEADRIVQAHRAGTFPQYLVERGHEIFDKIKKVVMADPTPATLGDYVTKAVEKYGEESPQVETVLQAFGRSKLQVTAGGKTQILSPSDIATSQPGQLAEIFRQEPITPQRALDTATALSGKIRGGAKTGFRRAFSSQDALNADARSVIYDVLKDRADEAGKQAITGALQEYGEFATMRNQALRTLSPFGNQQTPTTPGIKFLTRVASGEQTVQTPDDTRLIQFIKQATGNDPAAGLDELSNELKNAKSQQQTLRIIKNWIVRIGIAYPVIRTIFRGK